MTGTAEERLRLISRQWAARISEGRPFFANTDDVPLMRELLDGYDHPDELPEPDELPCIDCGKPANPPGNLCSDCIHRRLKETFAPRAQATREYVDHLKEQDSEQLETDRLAAWCRLPSPTGETCSYGRDHPVPWHSWTNESERDYCDEPNPEGGTPCRMYRGHVDLGLRHATSVATW